MTRENRHLPDGWLQKALDKATGRSYPLVMALTKPPVQRLRDHQRVPVTNEQETTHEEQ